MALGSNLSGLANAVNAITPILNLGMQWWGMNENLKLQKQNQNNILSRAYQADQNAIGQEKNRRTNATALMAHLGGNEEKVDEIKKDVEENGYYEEKAYKPKLYSV